jgi:hypothetical protein
VTELTEKEHETFFGDAIDSDWPETFFGDAIDSDWPVDSLDSNNLFGTYNQYQALREKSTTDVQGPEGYCGGANLSYLTTYKVSYHQG